MTTLAFNKLAVNSHPDTLLTLINLLAGRLTDRERQKNPLSLDPIEYRADYYVVCEKDAVRGQYYEATIVLHKQRRSWYLEQMEERSYQMPRPRYTYVYSEKGNFFQRSMEQVPDRGKTVLMERIRVTNDHPAARIQDSFTNGLERFVARLIVEGAAAVETNPSLIEETII